MPGPLRRRMLGVVSYDVDDPADRAGSGCPVCDGSPRVLVAIRHDGMRRLTAELLASEYRCWVAADLDRSEALGPRLDVDPPDLLVVDASDFPDCCGASLDRFGHDRVVVIAPEPDPGYGAHALANGAGAWIPRERVGDDLGPAMRAILGCRHDPCPPGPPVAPPALESFREAAAARPSSSRGGNGSGRLGTGAGGEGSAP